MNTNTTPRILTRSIAALLAAGAIQHQAHAASGTWNVDNGTNWSTAASWVSSIVADGIDSTASFTFNITADRTVTLDTARTIGNLTFTDATTASNNWILGGSQILTLDLTTGSPTINTTNQTATINVPLAGTDGLTTTGAGTTVLAGNNTWTGGLILSGASLTRIGNNNGAGSNAISFAAASTGRLIVGGGITINNTINIGAGITNAAGRGLIEAQDAGGLSTVNGAINITAAPTNGGMLRGGLTAGNELVLNGVITSSVQVTQRDGRVIYAGGGTGYTSMGITGTALLGANNGLSTTATPTVALSGTGTLDLRTFNQSVPAITFAGTAVATVTGSTGVLTLNGTATSSGNFTHVFNGNVDLNGGTRTFSIADGTQLIDMNAGAAFTNGTINKTGTGTLAMNGTSSASTNVTVTAGTLTGSGSIGGNVTANAGTVSGTLSVGGALGINTGVTLVPATLTTNGTITSGSLAFGTGTQTIRMDAGAGGDLLATGALTTAGGVATFNLNQFGGMLAPSATPYPLITFTGASPGLTGFALAPMGHATAVLDDTTTPGVLGVLVSANDRVVWKGTNTTAWATGATGNWELQTGATQTDYIEGDDVVFQDAPVNSNVVIGANVTPSNVAFTNTTATTYNVSGAAGITGTTGLTKTGDGTVTLTNPNTYTGTTAVSNGTLVLNYNNGTATTVLSTASPVNVTGAGVVRAIANDSAFAFNNNITGNGTVEINSHAVAGTAAQNVTFAGSNTGFTGTLRLLAPVGGNYRLMGTGNTAGTTPANLGSATIEVQSGGQIFTAANLTYTNNISSLAGIGYTETAPVGNLGALRLEGGSTWAGNIVIAGAGARINAHNVTATVSGNISGGPLEVNATPGIANVNGGTMIFTGANSYTTTTVGGSTSGTVASRRLNIGAGGTSGTLGTGAVSLNTDGHNAVLGFDRSDAYTLGAGNTITATGGALTRSFIDFDTLGAGFSDNGVTITLGGALATTGGQLRVAHSRAGAIANFTGATTAGTLLLGAQAGFGNGTVNLNSGAVMNVGTVRVSTGALNTSTINVNNGGTMTAFSVGLGDVSGGTGVLNQVAGSTVNIDRQLRVGHFPNNTSIYNMNGGTLTMTGVSPNLTPSTAGGGGASATGDNNINALVTPELVGGGIYIGIDGQGTFNHAAGTVTTNWIVLDNRAASVGGANMLDGLDRYSLNGTGELRLRSNWGLIGRNELSYLVSFGGGSVVVDNTGTGTGTGANITIPLDATIDTVASTTTTLDTNGAGNGFTLTKNVRGTGTLNVIGGGTLNLSTAGAQNIGAALTGAVSLNKIGTGATTLDGNLSGYTGNVTVTAGLLTVPTNLGAGNITVADGAAINGEPVLVNTLSLGSATGSTIFFNPNTAGALTTGTLTVAGVNNIDLAAIPSGAGPYTVINYTSKTGAGTFQAANPTSYRVAPTIDDTTGNMVTINYTGQKSLTWTGSASTAWNINSAINWVDTTPAPDVFFNLDTVTFPEGGLNPGIALTGNLAPAAINVTSATTNYTFTSSAGNQIVGATGINKTGASTLTLVGANTYTGKTTVGGGLVTIAASDSIGAGTPGNSIELSGGGRLNYSGTTAFDLGSNRSIAVGTGGGVLSHSGTTAVIYAVPGNLTGSGAFTLRTTGTSGTASTVTNYVLSGNNSGFTGDLSIESTGNILSTVAIPPDQNAVPNAANITINYPSGTVTNGNANVLSLTNVTVNSNLNMIANVSGAISQRAQVTTAGNVAFNGQVRLTGNSGAVVQFNPAAGSTVTLNGNIVESAPGSFGVSGATATIGVVFTRAAGNTIVNGNVNLPTAMFVRVDDGGTTTVNSTGNTWALSDVRSSSTLRIGANNALAIGAPLRIGQSTDAGNSVFELNGFNQEVAGLDYVNGNGANTRRVTNSSTTLSTLTINNVPSPAIGNVTGNYTFGSVAANGAGNLTGNLALVKNGPGTQTLAGPANTYTGNVTVNGGTLVASGSQTSTALGSVTTGGRTVTVNNNGSTLSLAVNNVFGNAANVATLPSVTLNAGTTLTSTRYNVIGPVALNGATMTQSATDTGSFEGYQFKGAVTVGGSAASTISTGNSKANHLDANTTFNVANATGDAAADLLVSAPLRNQSGDFALAAGGLTKDGVGTMEISSTSTYTGPTTVNNGVLRISGSISGSAVTINSGTLGGTGSTGSVNNIGGVIDPGASIGTLSTGAATLGSASSFSLEINSTALTTDLLASSGAVTISLATLNPTDLGAATLTSGETFTFITATGGVTGTFAGLPDGALLNVGASQYEIDYQASSVSLIAVPEPGALAALLGGMGVLAGLRRFRRR